MKEGPGYPAGQLDGFLMGFLVAVVYCTIIVWLLS